MRRKKREQLGFSRKKNRSLKFFFIGLFFILCIVLPLFLVRKYKLNYSGIPSLNEIYEDWENGDYSSVYLKTEAVLVKRPFDGEVLALHGFAAYYKFTGQTDFSLSYTYLNDSITSLRKALYFVQHSEVPKISYVLGKAYYQKGYYYADLAMKYLEITYNSGLKFDDLTEFIGMAASLLGDTDKAIQAFTEALAFNSSDLLLFALAQNYIKIYDEKNAKLYLFETISKTKDELLELKCRYLLGSLFLDENNLESAKKEFTTILEKDINSVDAHYGLGVIYEVQGDLIKARSEWRKALRLDPLHADTRSKLNLQ